ncbi:MAG: DNA-3-methyladenine glycosylase I, partial [Negativicutes bacterium]|nr:DNA-3-methyladenine glycosylase I [Negativicutes bacterium]
MPQRCDWSEINETMAKYHDNEWGIPLHNDQKLFEFLILD